MHAVVGFAILVGALGGGPAGAAEVRYLYSPNGEIYAAIDVDGSAAVFSFDEAGNLIGIARTDASAILGNVGIILVTPNQGVPNDVIELFGKGLANPSSVTFNGVAAIVQASDTNYIRTAVPAGATFGLIHVVTPLGQADSPTPFTVLGSLTITPGVVTLLLGQTQQFTASEPVVWTVEGALGGNAKVGTITASGLYTAPSTSLSRQIVIGAYTAGNPLNRAEAMVVIPSGIQSPWVSVGPKADPLPSSSVSVVQGATFAPLPGPPVSVAVGQPFTAALGIPPVAAQREPAITAVSPASVAQGATNVVLVLTGKGLGSPTALQFLLNNANDTLITYTSLTANAPGTRATATVSISGGAVISGRVIQITAGGVASTREGIRNVLQVTAAPTPWWNTSYHYRKPLTVTAGADALEVGYSVKLVFDHAALVSVGKSLSTGNDVRLTYWNGTTEVALDRVLGSGSGWNQATTSLWVKLQTAIPASGTDGNYYLYYGNTAPGSPPANADNVYQLYDAFSSGTLNAAKWTAVTSGAVTVVPTSGYLKVSGTTDATNQGQTFGIRSVPTFTGNVSIESTFRVFSQSTTAWANWKAAFGLGLDSTGLGVHSTASTNKRVQYWDGAAWVDLGDSTMDTQTFANKTILQTLLLDGTAKHSEAGALKATRTGVSTAARNLVFQYGPDQPNETFEVRFDTIIVRKYVASDASIALTLGAEVGR